LRDLVPAGGIDLVLVQDRDRLAREPACINILKEEFSQHGTKLRALNDKGDDSPEGQLTEGILDQLAKFERAKTAERSRRGRIEGNIWTPSTNGGLIWELSGGGAICGECGYRLKTHATSNSAMRLWSSG
jgi:Resolvase, N terminal domain